MESSPPCPELEEMQRFLVGAVSDPELEQIERHLGQCSKCLQVLPTLRVEEDPVARALRGQAEAPVEDTDEQVEAMIRRLEALRLPAAETPHEATLPHEPTEQPPPGEPVSGSSAELKRSSAELTAELYDYLAPPQEPGELGRLGPYRILDVLGAGGMGVVFRAEDTNLGRLVALKVLPPALTHSANARKRFLREARAAASVEHEHIVYINQVGEDRGIPYVAMPLLQGQSLESRLQRKERLPVAEVLRIGREIAEGLTVAHERGLVHRDIKPANVWLEGRRDRVKILDFGLARPVEGGADLTRKGLVVGTPAYMAPEQAQGRPVDQRSDLFSLGCLLYRMCTSRPPFGGATALEILSALALREPTPPRELNPEVPAPLNELVLRLLAKDPAGRPAAAREVAETLAALEQGQETGVRPRPAAVPPARRRRWSWVVAAALLLAGGAVVLGLVLHISRDRDPLAAVNALDLGAEAEWLEAVGRLEPPQQVEAVADRLRKLNPGFDGKAKSVVEDGKVIVLEVETDQITDISPVRALTWLSVLKCSGSGIGRGRLTDLAGLKGLHLQSLDFRCNSVSDLGPLRGMPLRHLVFERNWLVHDLEPLRGMPLRTLNCGETAVSSLAPLRGLPLSVLDCGNTRIKDLEALKGMSLLYSLGFPVTQVDSLEPLRGMPLDLLSFGGTRVTDLSPLKGVPLKVIYFDFNPERDTEVLRSIKTLVLINRKPAAEFWKDVEAAEKARRKAPRPGEGEK